MLTNYKQRLILPHISGAGVRKDLRIVNSAVVNGRYVCSPAWQVPRIIGTRVLLSQEALALSLLDDLARG